MIALPVACRVDGKAMDGITSLLPDLQGGPLGLRLGPELLLNGTFDTDTVWTKGTGWSIAAGVGARAFDVSSGSISQSVAFVSGRSYQVTFTLLGYVSGIFAARFTGGTTRTGTTRSANGTYTQILLANTGNNMFEIIAGGSAEGSIDDVSCREVL